MIQNLVNKVARLFQCYEQSKYPYSVMLDMYRVIQLDQYSCGIQSALVILKYFGKVNTINDILYDKRVLEEDGIDTNPLLNLIRSNGVKVTVNKNADLDDIKEALIERKPVLISIDEGEHWVVVYGFSEDRIFVLDSSLYSSIRCSWTYEEFLDRWDDNWIAVVSNN
ncbi:MAG: cysteine peptidase family C39 domain-containing protein [Melioribacteraceae bacterium]|nr:cysteine peptidase family C39 domain-containing protein [Melioribacteraceae bacterium]